MKKFATVCGISCVLMSLCLLLGPNTSRAAIEDNVKEALDKIADALEKGDNATAKKEATALAKKIDELNDVMHAFKPRNAKKGVKGIGWGSKKGVVTPDAIEQKLVAIGRDGIAAGDLKKEGEALAKGGWHIAAIAEVTIARAPDKDMGKKKVADWMKWSQDMKEAAVEFAKAAKTGSAADVKTATNKLNNSCNNCHPIFRN